MSNLHEAHQVRVYYRFEEIDSSEPGAGTLHDVADESDAVLPTHHYYDPEVTEPFVGDGGLISGGFEPGSAQRGRIIDWTFGVILPLICFYFDPFVFRGPAIGSDGLLHAYQLPVYTVAGTSVMTMAAWLLWGEKLGSLRLPVAFVMLVGAVMSSILAAVLFPFSMVGLLVIIGVLGFTPGFTAFVFWRNAFRVLRSLRTNEEKRYGD
jgi:hypothetical protein